MIPAYPVDADVQLNDQGTWPASIHHFDERAVAALRAAEACGRPLLVRGSPGVGKSQTARAAAAFAERPFLSVVIDGRTEAHDLMWRFDAVRRLSDAQATRRDALLAEEASYVEPQALWWAYDWVSAASKSGEHPPPCERPHNWDPENNRAVLLIDEIDKADPDLPNALLEILANKGFRVPYGGQLVRCGDQNRPLVVITTNEERELPSAFLRRCLVLTLELPEGKSALCNYLVDIGQRHERFLLTKRAGRCFVMQQAAERLWDAREGARKAAEYMPGTAEFLDLINALSALWPDDAKAQIQSIERLDEFAFRKSVPSRA
ncbi:AAA family ATPase [Roseateles sp.]|uniref:AAA family ATPase n=1 Tax=Roseateles sp. TaxID=1971397 RepID=UPI003D0DB8F3